MKKIRKVIGHKNTQVLIYDAAQNVLLFGTHRFVCPLLNMLYIDIIHVEYDSVPCTVKGVNINEKKYVTNTD